MDLLLLGFFSCRMYSTKFTLGKCILCAKKIADISLLLGYVTRSSESLRLKTFGVLQNILQLGIHGNRGTNVVKVLVYFLRSSEITITFLCHLGSIAAHMDHFVRRLFVCLSGSYSFLVVTHSYVLQATHAFLGMLPLFYKYCTCNNA